MANERTNRFHESWFQRHEIQRALDNNDIDWRLFLQRLVEGLLTISWLDPIGSSSCVAAAVGCWLCWYSPGQVMTSIRGLGSNHFFIIDPGIIFLQHPIARNTPEISDIRQFDPTDYRFWFKCWLFSFEYCAQPLQKAEGIATTNSIYVQRCPITS